MKLPAIAVLSFSMLTSPAAAAAESEKGIKFENEMSPVSAPCGRHQRNKDFSACNLSYIQTYPNGNTLDPEALEYLETCMAASGYKFDYRLCPDSNMRNVGSCYPTGFLPH